MNQIGDLHKAFSSKPAAMETAPHTSWWLNQKKRMVHQSKQRKGSCGPVRSVLGYMPKRSNYEGTCYQKDTKNKLEWIKALVLLWK